MKEMLAKTRISDSVVVEKLEKTDNVPKRRETSRESERKNVTKPSSSHSATRNSIPKTNNKNIKTPIVNKSNTDQDNKIR